MTPAELADIAANEACERVTNAYMTIIDTCDGEECPLTSAQKLFVGTALLSACMDLRVDLDRMFSNAAVLEKWREPTPFADQIMGWLSKQKGPFQ